MQFAGSAQNRHPTSDQFFHMSISKIISTLEAAGYSVTKWDKGHTTRVYVNSTPNGGKGQYGYLVSGDDGTTGTCQGITKRKGEIAATLRGE